MVETNGQALVERLKTIPGKRHVVLEEGTQSGWLYEILSPHAEQIVVAMVSELLFRQDYRLGRGRAALPVGRV